MPLHSLFSMAARVILLNGKWKHDQNAPMAPHFSWIQRQNLGMVCCPPTPPPSPTVLPALLPFSHTPTRLLSPFMLAINSPWEQFSQGPTRLAPWLHSGLYSNLSLRDFCISPCVKECVHTHTHTHTLSFHVLLHLSPPDIIYIYAYYLLLPFLSFLYQSRAVSCLLLDSCCLIYPEHSNICEVSGLRDEWITLQCRKILVASSSSYSSEYIYYHILRRLWLNSFQPYKTGFALFPSYNEVVYYQKSSTPESSFFFFSSLSVLSKCIQAPWLTCTVTVLTD